MFSIFKKKKKPKKTLTITDANFNELVNTATQPILIDFWADWCGPCKTIGPIIDELAEDFDGRAIVGKVDVQANQKLAAHFKVKSIPTLMVIAHGQLFERFQGLIPKPNLEEILEEYIADFDSLKPKPNDTKDSTKEG